MKNKKQDICKTTEDDSTRKILFKINSSAKKWNLSAQIGSNNTQVFVRTRKILFHIAYNSSNMCTSGYKWLQVGASTLY